MLKHVLFCALLFGCAGLRASETPLPAKEKFHVFLLIGQSNMAGRGKIDDEEKTPHPRVLMLNKDNEWVPAVAPLHFDKPKIAGAGLGLTFGKTLAEKEPGVTIGLIPCAFGGTKISEWKKGERLYVDAVKRARLAMEHGTLAGILWHQGESDCAPQDNTRTYSQSLKQLIADLRADLDAPETPFIMGQLGEYLYEKTPVTKSFNESLVEFAKSNPHTACVLSHGLTPNNDVLHFNTESLKEFGRRYAAEYFKMTGEAPAKP